MAGGNFTFSCQHCGQRLEAEPDMVGMEFDCPSCGKTLAVPSLSFGEELPLCAYGPFNYGD